MSEARDIAWREYSKTLDPITRDHVVAKNAFVAGWNARKAISMLGLPRPGYDTMGQRVLEPPPVNCPHGVAMDIFCEQCEPRNKPPEPGT